MYSIIIFIILFKSIMIYSRKLGLITFYYFQFLKAMIEVICNDRMGKKVRVKCNPDDTIGDLKKLIAAQIGIY